MINWSNVDKVAKEWLKEAGKNIIASFKTALQIDTKADANDLVTNIDKEIEQYFINRIRETFPSHNILGEEGFGDEVESMDGVVWIIDPVDGTMNFVHQQRNFFISIGIFENGEGKLGYLYDVVHNELYYAKSGEGAFWDELRLPTLEKVEVSEAVIGLSASLLISSDPNNPFASIVKDVRGTRSYGSAALEFAYVATGRLDAYISKTLSPWDFAGGIIIVEEIGGVVTDFNGQPLNLLKKSPVIVAKPGLHETLIKQYFQVN
ncbi:inositol monophosphatase family protein [Bacillus sp. FJAT-49732]|uniref:inositol-phosphate phosphatase n=1 Tax=Lederbergia citrisecunda TaxID=2833583 RepID=A0A942YJP2_9BACI|nr:inositol monophosphatase family protein [Lederbergia citrisecunda]MBS4198812.1 inositol monophosphatase family protein [Lederbergia citrisecunda]